MTNGWDWINETFARANARTAALPRSARPIITRPVTSRSAPTADEFARVYEADRLARMQLCSHPTCTYRPGERPSCEDCGAQQARIIWMDPNTGTELT